MLKWYLQVADLLTEIRKKAFKILELMNDEDESANVVIEYIKKDYQNLAALFSDVNSSMPGNLGRHLHFSELNDFEDIVKRDIDDVESLALKLLSDSSLQDGDVKILNDLLDESVVNASLKLYKEGHYREAVLNAVISVFDIIRSRSGRSGDGEGLVTSVFSLSNPVLLVSDLSTESGRSDQKGFLMMLQGAYQGIRNPKSHSLEHDLDQKKAAQYLVFASLLARRVKEAKINR